MKKTLLTLIALLGCMLSVQAVTFSVRVPSGTKKCYVCGDFNGWDAGGALQMTPDGTDRFVLNLPDVSASDVAKGYKYLCGQDWTYVEKDASGNEISNRTAIGNPDVVGSWYNVPDWGVESVELTVNGIPRLVKVYVPEGYDNGNASYPVIYYNTVQQRYNDAGNDADAGDDFFGSKSWDAHTTMESLRSRGVEPSIMVQVCSLLGENTPEANPEFTGTGGAKAYLEAFATQLMPYVAGRWRVRTDAYSTTIVGADFGALFSLYAAIERPDLFGHCVAMSPMLWINDGYFNEATARASAGQTYLISAGTAEPQWMQKDAAALAASFPLAGGVAAYYTPFEGATHDDESWGDCFGNVLLGLTNTPPNPAVAPRRIRKAPDATPFPQRTYTLYAGADRNNLQKIGPLSYTEDYRKKGSDTPVAAFVNTNEIGLSFKSTYYWNIACGEDAGAGWLLDNVKDIGFSSKKSEPSWQNVAVFEDGSVADIAAHSKGFRLVTSSGETAMTKADPFSAYATVSFPGKDKGFHINFGSVNSASDMGAVTPEIYVGDNCIEAVVTYDFNLNKVSVTETKFGESIDNLRVASFTAVPAVCGAGDNVHIALELSGAGGVEVECRKDFTQAIAFSTVKDSESAYHIDLSDLQPGLYTFTVALRVGDTRQPNAAEINVRVLPAASSDAKVLTVNAYRDVDWESTGRFKANFHTHTSQSFDTQFTTTQVVDRYRNAGYEILALTDHDANPYPWSMFSLYNPLAQDRDAATMGMLAVPGVELSKDRRNNWSEKTGGEFNHHNDFFTGRRGQEFMSLRESYAYSQAVGGLQIINHPGQYWNLSTEYRNGEKNSPEWHAENFRLYSSLVGLEVYNQGNRRPNDRILWDQILTLTMPGRPVWGYSCDDTHTAEQYFRNYQFMLMPSLDTETLKEAMKDGATVFSYEYTGSGQALAPRVKSVTVDEESGTITVDCDDADTVEWIYSTHRTNPSSASSTKSTVVGLGHTFNYTGFQGSYIRARLVNKYGETALQPFGFDVSTGSTSVGDMMSSGSPLESSYDASAQTLSLFCAEGIERVTLVNAAGMIVGASEYDGTTHTAVSTSSLAPGVYVAVVATPRAAYTTKFMK